MTDRVEIESERAHREIVTKHITRGIVGVALIVCGSIVGWRYLSRVNPPSSCESCLEILKEYDCTHWTVAGSNAPKSLCLQHVEKQLGKCLTLCPSQGSEDHGETSG